MSAMTYEEVLRVVGSRNGLDDPRFYVGRREERAKCAGLGRTVKVVWVHGAKRIGKTAFADDVARAFQASHHDGQVLRLDASGSKSFDELLVRLLERAGWPREGDPRARFEQFADRTRHGPPRLIVLDELDRLALTLGIDEQGLLRRLTTEDRRLSYVIITHVAPWRIVEEVADVASRLLGIAQIISLPILTNDGVRTLFEAVAKALDLESLVSLAAPTWDAVGGHPVSVMTVLQKAVISASEGWRDFDWVFDEIRGELLHQMGALWRDLSPGTRAILLDPRAVNDSASRSEAKSDGFLTRRQEIARPALLMEAAKTVDTAGNGDSLRTETAATIELHDAIFEVNAAAKTRYGRAWFASTDETRRQVRSMRPSRCEADFRSVVNHLHVVVYEAARELDPDRRPESDPQRWRVPQPHTPIFAGSEGIKALKAYRAHFEHDPDFGREEGDEHDRHRRVGRVFKRACGVEWPGDLPELWARAHAQLLADLGAATKALLRAIRE